MTEKKEIFDREIKALFKQSSELLNVRYGISNNTGKVRKELACLTRFENVYHGLENPSEFYVYFEKLFSKKRTSILKSLDNDSWIKNGNIIIQFGEDCKELKGKCENVKILLSNIYNCALELKESSLNVYSDLSEELGGQDKNLIRPSILLLHLLRIFNVLSDSNDDKLALSIMIDTLESDLNVKNKTVKPIVNPFANMNANTDMLSETLNTVFSAVTSIARNLNIEGLDEIQAPTGQQIKEGLDNTINNEKVQSGIGNLMKALNNKEDMVSSFSNFIKDVMTPEMIETTQNALLKTAEIAKENAQK
jgi:hypothetical protein